MAPDGLPVMGRLPLYDNVFVSTGHAMLGVTLAPASGEAMAELVEVGQTRRYSSPWFPADSHAT